MSQYDGPSIFRREHSKNKESTTNKHKNRQVNLENKHKKNLPTNIQTRTEVQREIKKHMHTSPTQSVRHTKEKSWRFHKKYIPPSMQQKKENNKIEEKNEWLRTELEKRLKKDSNSYLLFSNHLNDEKKENQNSILADQAERKNKKKSQSKYHHKKEEKVKKIKKEMKKSKIKPASALHRSFSSIIEEEQAFLKSSEEKLNSLFSNHKKN